MTTAPQSISVQISEKTIACVDCQANFVFTVREQLRFLANDFRDPKRCEPCRKEKRRKNAAADSGSGARR